MRATTVSGVEFGGCVAVNDPLAGAPLAPDLVDVGFVRSKILPRRLPLGAISRPRLLERLRAGRRSSLTLLSAPAGYGKTTLLTAWQGSVAPTRCAWVSLDRRDTDPIRLWTHLIVALNEVEQRAGTGSLTALRARPDRLEEYALPVLLEELTGDGPDLVVILDDYHLAESPVVNATIEALLRYRPDRLQVVISTRADPVLGIPRLRAMGELSEIRAADLRFDRHEVAQFLAGVGVVGLSDEETSRLADSTEGWPAPLRLLALLIPQHEPRAFIDSFAGARRPVVEYLTTDVLELLEPAAQEFVLRVSILTRMCGALCDAVVGAPGSGILLAELERAGLFISADSAGDWYQQHHLFAEAMRLELARAEPELLPRLHLRAARWFEAAGDLESATDHAIESRDVAVAARLVAAQVESLAARGRWATVHGWLADLSWPSALADPELAWVRATSDTFAHDLDGAEQWLNTASSGVPEAVGSLTLPLGYRVEMLRSLVGVNDVSAAEHAAHRALAIAPGPMWQGAALAGLGQAQYLRGETAQARATLRRAVGLIPDAHPNLLVFAISNFALAEYADGGGPHADPVLDRAVEMMTIQPHTVVGAILHMALGERARAGGDPRAAVGWFGSAIAILGEGKRSAWLANAYLLNASAFRALGDTSGEIRCLDAADAILDTLSDPGDLARRSRSLRERARSVNRRRTRFGAVLSDREIAVLQLAGARLTQREIADQLFISFNTVKSHLRSAYSKLGVNSRDDALASLANLQGDPAPHHGDESTPATPTRAT